MNGAESATEAAGGFYQFLHSGILLDVALVFAIFLLRAGVLALTARSVSRGLADVSVKATVWATLLLCGIYFFANPSAQTDAIRPFLLTVAIGIFICKRAFWIHLDQALACSLIGCLLFLFLGDYPRRVLDKHRPDRPTVNRSLAHAIDRYAARGSVASTNEPSEDILTAVVRTTASATNGMVGSMLGFLRAGLEAKAEVERLQKIAAQEALIANLLAGGGTNVHSRAAEMSAMNSLFGPTDTNAPAVPIMQGTNGTRHGYMETYAAAKATIEEANRVASNNAAIVNMLSGIGERVTDRREEMDKLHQALLAEAMQGHIDLSNAGEPISDAQIESLREAMGITGPADAAAVADGSTNSAAAQASAAAIRAALESMRGAAGVFAASTNVLPAGVTNPPAGYVNMDHVHRALLDDALRGTIDLRTNGPAVTEKQVIKVQRSVAARIAEEERLAADQTVAGKLAKVVGLRKLFEPKAPVDFDAVETNTVEEVATVDLSPGAPSLGTIQIALDEIRKAAADYTAVQHEIAIARAKTRALSWDRACRDFIRSWNTPHAERRYRSNPMVSLVGLNVFESLSICRVPWGGSLLFIRTSVTTALTGAVPETRDPVSVKSELIVARSAPAPVKSGEKAKPPPSPYELLSKADRAKWDAALQKVQVSGVVGSAADVAAIVNGGLVRRGETVIITDAGGSYTFRLTGISSKGKCQWEPMIVLGPRKAPSTVTVTF